MLYSDMKNLQSALVCEYVVKYIMAFKNCQEFFSSWWVGGMVWASLFVTPLCLVVFLKWYTCGVARAVAL